MVTGSKPTNEDHQRELMPFGIGLEIRAYPLEVFGLIRRCFVSQNGLCWPGGVSFRHGYQWGTILMSQTVLFWVRSFAGEDLLQFSAHTLQLSTAVLLTLMRNNADNDHDHGLRAAGTTSWPPSALLCTNYFKGSMSFTSHHTLVSYLLPLSALHRWGDRIRGIKFLACGRQSS